MYSETNGKLFFSEDLYKSHKVNLEVEEILEVERMTDYQSISVFKTKDFGNVLVLDGIIQLVEFDEHVYHETIAHTPMHINNAKNILIIGGGDGGVAREVLKHEVESVTIVDIDPVVTELTKKHFKNFREVFNDTRLKVLHQDGSQIDQLFAGEKFDLIILDTTDETDVAESIFGKGFLDKVKAILSPEGIVMRLGGSFYFQRDILSELNKDIQEVFNNMDVHVVTFSGAFTYYGGPFCLFMITPPQIELGPKTKNVETKWYNQSRHLASLNTISSHDF